MPLFKKKKDSSVSTQTDYKKKELLTSEDSKSLVSSTPAVSKKISQKTALNSRLKGVRSSLSNTVFGNYLLRPIITEKTTIMSEESNCYVFEVDPRANKISIKKAIAEIYNLTPIKVNIIRTKGKKVRYGHSQGRTKNRKRALIFLKKGDRIEFVKNK